MNENKLIYILNILDVLHPLNNITEVGISAGSIYYRLDYGEEEWITLEELKKQINA